MAHINTKILFNTITNKSKIFLRFFSYAFFFRCSSFYSSQICIIIATFDCALIKLILHLFHTVVIYSSPKRGQMRDNAVASRLRLGFYVTTAFHWLVMLSQQLVTSFSTHLANTVSQVDVDRVSKWSRTILFHKEIANNLWDGFYLGLVPPSKYLTSKKPHINTTNS